MAAIPDLLKVKQEDDILVVTIAKELLGFDYQRLQVEGERVLNLLRSRDAPKVVVDLHQSDYITSAVLGWFLILWKRIRERNGRMVLCGLSAYALEIFKVTSLDNLWPICSSKEEALAAIRK